MKKSVLILFIFFPLLLSAQYAERERSGKVVIRDGEGYILEKRSIDRNGDFIIEDPSGRVIHIITKDENGNILILDGNENVLQEVAVHRPYPYPNTNPHDPFDFSDDDISISIKNDIFGNTLYERDGRTVFKVGKNIFDENFIEDENGRTLRKIKRDIFGNKIVEGENGKEIMSLDERTFKDMLKSRGITEEEWEREIIDRYIYSRLYRRR